MTPICPKCGTVAVRKVSAGKYICERDGCGHLGSRNSFMTGGPGTHRHYSNQHWRDPVALSMDGYEGEG